VSLSSHANDAIIPGPKTFIKVVFTFEFGSISEWYGPNTDCITFVDVESLYESSIFSNPELLGIHEYAMSPFFIENEPSTIGDLTIDTLLFPKDF